MYTIQPLIDSSNYHIGWYLYLAVCLIFAGMLIHKTFEEGFDPEILYFIAGCILLGWLINHVSYSDTPPVNKRVVAQFVGFTAEYESRKSGKNSTTIDHYVYGNFRVPEGNVTIKVSPGIAIADSVILYKN